MRNVLLFLGSMLKYLRPLVKAWNAASMILYTGYRSVGFKEFGRTSRMRPCFNSLEGEKYISVGERCYFGHDMFLQAIDSFEGQTYSPRITFGNNCIFGDFSQITAVSTITIGNNVLTGKYVLITDNAHGESNVSMLSVAPNLRPLSSKGPIVVEDNVWIGDKACILPGVKVGRGAIIGALSVVTCDVPENAVVAGNPAKIIKIMQ